jgi:hypothetical protein
MTAVLDSLAGTNQKGNQVKEKVYLYDALKLAQSFILTLTYHQLMTQYKRVCSSFPGAGALAHL